MKGKNLLILIVAAAALTTIAVFTSRDTSNQETHAVIGKQVFPELPINDISRIVIKKGSSSITLNRLEDKWICPNKYNYPVEFDKVKQTVLQLADLKIGQKMMVNDDQRSKMGMKGSEPDNTGTILELLGDGNDIKARLLIGETRQSVAQAGHSGFGGYPDGTFISPDLGSTVYLVKDAFYNVTAEAKGWLITELLDVSPSDIRRITIKNLDPKPLVFVSNEKGEITLEGLAENEECNTSTLSSIKSALSSLHLDDIADPALTDQQLGMDKAIIYEAETANGGIYSVKIGAAPEANASKYVRISVGLKPEEKKDVAENKTAVTDEEKKAAEEKENKARTEREELEKQIKALNDKVSKWTYMIALYKTDNMACTRENVVILKKGKDEDKASE